MERRRFIPTLAASAIVVAESGTTVFAEPPSENIPQIFRIPKDLVLKLDVESQPVSVDEKTFSLIQLGECKLSIDLDCRLKAAIKSSTSSFADIEYWISLAVFDNDRRFLGAATHKEHLGNDRGSLDVTYFSEIELDFGISKAYKSAAYLAVAISDRDLPQQN